MVRRQSAVMLALCVGLLGTDVRADGSLLPSFAGPYLGGAVGYGRQEVDVDNQSLGASFSDREGGATFGGYGGYNWFCSPFVLLGVEADFNYLGTSPTAVSVLTGPTALTETTTLESRLDWFGTLRGRLGYAVQKDLLLYATGGLAYARVDHTLSDNCVGCGTSVFNLGPFTQSNDDTRAGWVVGGGAEFAHYGKWLVRAEALYVDLGSKSRTYVISTPVATATALTKWNDEFWLARVGLAYKFVGP